MIGYVWYWLCRIVYDRLCLDTAMLMNTEVIPIQAVLSRLWLRSCQNSDASMNTVIIAKGGCHAIDAVRAYYILFSLMSALVTFVIPGLFRSSQVGVIRSSFFSMLGSSMQFSSITCHVRISGYPALDLSWIIVILQAVRHILTTELSKPRLAAGALFCTYSDIIILVIFIISMVYGLWEPCSEPYETCLYPLLYLCYSTCCTPYITAGMYAASPAARPKGVSWAIIACSGMCCTGRPITAVLINIIQWDSLLYEVTISSSTVGLACSRGHYCSMAHMTRTVISMLYQA